MVYSSFESEELAATGMMPMPSAEDLAQGPIGGHALCAVGYDDSKQAFIIRNSWGPYWGLSGYFYMPYAYIANPSYASDFWMIEK